MTASMPRRRRIDCRRTEETGAIVVTFALCLIVLVSMLGLVIDLGHLYIAKTELQNAADACSLGAARELIVRDSTAAGRARTAGRAIAALNFVDFQRNGVAVGDADIMFSENAAGPWGDEVVAATRYVRCAPYERAPWSVVAWFMRVAGVQSMDVYATAVARLVSGQTTCAIPLATCVVKDLSELKLGSWYTGRLAPGSTTTGMYDWIRFGTQGSRDLADLIAGEGLCDISRPEVVDAQAGVSGGVVARAWNTRFGLYSNPYSDYVSSPPDETGYAFRDDATSPCHPSTEAVPGIGCWNTYQSMAATHQQFQGAASPLPGNPTIPGTAFYEQNGQARRRVGIAPIIQCNAWAPNKKDIPVLGWACMLMLAPIEDAGAVRYEFRRLADDPESPCATVGFPGGGGGLVPALVQ